MRSSVFADSCRHHGCQSSHSAASHLVIVLFAPTVVPPIRCCCVHRILRCVLFARAGPAAAAAASVRVFVSWVAVNVDNTLPVLRCWHVVTAELAVLQFTAVARHQSRLSCYCSPTTLCALIRTAQRTCCTVCLWLPTAPPSPVCHILLGALTWTILRGGTLFFYQNLQFVQDVLSPSGMTFHLSYPNR